MPLGAERERPHAATATPEFEAYAFGPFKVEAASLQLLRGEEQIPLPPKAFDTLLILLRNHTRVVTKDELMRLVWRDAFVTEDSLSSNAPHIETLQDHDLHYILGVKEGDHAYLFQQVQAAEHAGRVTSYERHDRAAGRVHRFRFLNDVPLNASHAEVRVNFIEYWEMGQNKVQHFSWVTDLRVNKRNVFHLMG